MYISGSFTLHKCVYGKLFLHLYSSDSALVDYQVLGQQNNVLSHLQSGILPLVNK